MGETYKAALELWGAEAQTLMAMEEMAELQKELCKHARGKENRKEIAEEIADVRIMLDQMAILHDCEELAGKFKEQKIERLGKLIRRKKGAEEGRSNADRIRAMDNGELAMLLCSADFCECCKYEQGGICCYIEEYPDSGPYDGCVQTAEEWLRNPADMREE
ncbi:hypothetical protein H8711_05930 [Clostridiaceae bacterium NSJ-31]|uniref:Uncharacterized protein n=1 Tax=Ligaoa zhengdingensis TaxID=2763658 RepID=A0A926DZL6_9FIRM|nr:hypothetical protein [Ligaoa zhengdingensis]MBC8546472.1 hypothetical protein [Ligaoa zhengdingensis]